MCSSLGFQPENCISRCVRRAFLSSEGEDSNSGDRKDWIERRLKELAEIFAVSVGGFSVMDNHLHLLLRLDSLKAEEWTVEEVVNRWFKLFPPRGTDRKPLPPEKLKALVTERLKDAEWIASTRAIGVAELVYEVLERTVVENGQQS